MPSIESSKP
jgi:hypothetical protein